MIDYTDLIGVPFVDGGRNPKVGLDCYGLVTEVFKRFAVNLPDYRICCEDTATINEEINKQRPRWIKQDPTNLPVPCLVVIKFNTVFCNHTGVYIGNGKFIHTRQRIGVNVEDIDSIIWKRRIDGFYVPSEEVVNESTNHCYSP